MVFLKKKKAAFEGGGLVLFDSVQDAMLAEKTLEKADYLVKLVAPPPELRKGCDLAVAINLVEQPGVERVLRQSGVSFVEITPLKPGMPEILEIVKVTDLGNWVMAKAANMKLTYEKQSGRIVNTSGGGCPDIPYMHAELIDKPVEEATRPGELGYTLCALMLDRALEECLSIWKAGRLK